MIIINLNKKLFVILILLIFSVFSAFVIEYILGHEPCRLCLYQRIPYFLSIILIFNILFFKKYIKYSLLSLAMISLVGSGIAFYHFGIEQGFFEESFVCNATNLGDSFTKEQILSQLKTNVISCKNVTFSLFGLSLASINTVFSFLLFCIFINNYKNYETNK